MPNCIEDFKPINYQELRYIDRDGFQYKQPSVFVDGEFSFWGFPSGGSEKYNKILSYLNIDSKLWDSELFKIEVFSKILEHENKSCSSITPLFPIEIYFICNGYKLDKFYALTKLEPIRVYSKGEKNITVWCSHGMKTEIRKDGVIIDTINYPTFSVQMNDTFYYIPNEIEMFDELESGNGKIIYSFK